MGARSKTRDQSIAETQGAINAASQRLRPILGPGIQRAVIHLNGASQWLYNGVQLVEVHVKMKLGEYYALQSAHLRELQQRANAAIAKARERIHRDLTKVDVLAEQNIRKVQPIIQNGLLSLAVMDPKVANLMIDVSLWVEGSAEEVRSRLLNEARAGVDGLSHAAHVGVVDLSVAVGTLDANARKVLQGIRINSQQAAQLVRTGFIGLRGVAGSWELLLALGSLYLINDSLEKNLKKAEAEMGDKSREAVMALHGSRLAMLGGGIEAVGLVMRESSKHIAGNAAFTAYGATRVQTAIAVGGQLARTGAVVGAVAGIYDASQADMAAKRSLASGDNRAHSDYSVASYLYIGGVGASIIAVYFPVFLGPLGVAITLGISAYWMTKRAEANESTPIERWARRSYFGKANETPPIHWLSPESADVAFAELNAATLGLNTSISFEITNTGPTIVSRAGRIERLTPVKKIKFQISIPQYDEVVASYRWAVHIHRFGDGHAQKYYRGELVCSGEFQPLPEIQIFPSRGVFEPSPPTMREDYDRKSIFLNQSENLIYECA